jgi:hypothetical protein
MCILNAKQKWEEWWIGSFVFQILIQCDSSSNLIVVSCLLKKQIYFMGILSMWAKCVIRVSTYQTCINNFLVSKVEVTTIDTIHIYM